MHFRDIRVSAIFLFESRLMFIPANAPCHDIFTLKNYYMRGGSLFSLYPAKFDTCNGDDHLILGVYHGFTKLIVT